MVHGNFMLSHSWKEMVSYFANYKGRFTRYDFVAYEKLTTSLRQAYDRSTTPEASCRLIYEKQFIS